MYGLISEYMYSLYQLKIQHMFLNQFSIFQSGFNKLTVGVQWVAQALFHLCFRQSMGTDALHPELLTGLADVLSWPLCCI